MTMRDPTPDILLLLFDDGDDGVVAVLHDFCVYRTDRLLLFYLLFPDCW